jgi:hypothetical protein
MDASVLLNNNWCILFVAIHLDLTLPLVCSLALWH